MATAGSASGEEYREKWWGKADVKMRLRPCIDCGRLSELPRCLEHRRARDRQVYRGSSTYRGYDSRYRKLRERVIADHVAKNGWTCPGYGRQAHPVNPGRLTADHVLPLSQGGANIRANLAPLCLSCNSRKEGRSIGKRSESQKSEEKR